MLRSTLTQAGYSVIAASDGDEGIKKAAEELPDLIILDIMMPVMDGGEVAVVLRNDPQTNKIPIIFLSSLISERYKRESSRRSSITYLPKPYQKDDLLNAIKKSFK